MTTPFLQNDHYTNRNQIVMVVYRKRVIFNPKQIKICWVWPRLNAYSKRVIWIWVRGWEKQPRPPANMLIPDKKNSTLQSLLMKRMYWYYYFNNEYRLLSINRTFIILYVNALCSHRIQNKMILKCIPFMKQIRHLFILTDLCYSVILWY